MSVRGNAIWGTVRRGIVLLRNCLFGELPFGELSIENLSVGEVSSGNCPLWESPLGKCPSGNCPRTKLQYGPDLCRKPNRLWAVTFNVNAKRQLRWNLSGPRKLSDIKRKLVAGRKIRNTPSSTKEEDKVKKGKKNCDKWLCLWWITFVLKGLFMWRETSHLSEILFIPVSLHAYL